MPDDRTSAFIEALHTLEREGDAEPLARLYADGAVSGNSSLRRTFDGAEGAREFWREYRSTFDSIRSEFRQVLSDGDASALEWTSEGSLANGGGSFEYEGVSVIEWDGDRIRRFTAYFDPASLGLQSPRAASS